MLSIMRQHGVTLIEIAITVAIAGILMALAMPNMTAWLNNSKIRTAGDTLLSGLNLARTEALRRNATVRFQLTDSLTSSCALSGTGTNWIVSLSDPTGKCDIAPDPNPAGTAPQTIQKRSGDEGTKNLEITATGGTTIFFNGLGRLTTVGVATNITTIDIANAAGGICQHVVATGAMRCLRITISAGGNLRLCDPAVTVATDPRYC